MKILVAGPQFPDSFARNIVVTLERMGHQATKVRGVRTRHHGRKLATAFWAYLPKAIPSLEKKLFREVVQKAASMQPDLVLVTYGSMPPRVVSDLKRVCAARIICWFTDPASNLYRYYLLASDFDFVFLKEPFLVRVARDKLGLNAFYLPECCNPVWHRPIALNAGDRKKYGCDLAAQGSLHYYRARMLETFADYELKIWGRNCPAWLDSPVKNRYPNRFIAEGEKAKAFGSAKIVVNTLQCAEIEGVNCTLFEAAGCGAFQIADWKPALPGLFEPEREIVTFRTRRELKEKADYYLAHPGERREIAARACARAHRDHTYEKRLQKMFEVLGLAEKGREFIPVERPAAKASDSSSQDNICFPAKGHEFTRAVNARNQNGGFSRRS
jgi:spore maturation protein CgeB